MGNPAKKIVQSDFPQSSSNSPSRWYLNPTLWIVTLGYYVDMYDFTIYANVRIQSLKALGVTDPAKIMSVGIFIANWGMFGLVIGGILAGMLGDKLGRKSILYASVLVYSIASLANAYVTDVNTYAMLRAFGGIGLAGECGIAITLINEILSAETRGWATSVVAAVGLLGSFSASLASETLAWSTCYILGGVLGLLLLVVRVRVMESGMFDRMKGTTVPKGKFLMLMSRKRIATYFACVLAGTPAYVVIGLMLPLAPELAKSAGVTEVVTLGSIGMVCSIATGLGDLACGLLSQFFRNRKKVVGAFAIAIALLTAAIIFGTGYSRNTFYAIAFGLAFSAGYVAVFTTMVAEQFGTNLRATAATSVLSFARGSTIPMRLAFLGLAAQYSTRWGISAVAGVSVALGLLALLVIPESYGKSLDFLED